MCVVALLSVLSASSAVERPLPEPGDTVPVAAVAGATAGLLAGTVAALATGAFDNVADVHRPGIMMASGYFVGSVAGAAVGGLVANDAEAALFGSLGVAAGVAPMTLLMGTTVRTIEPWSDTGTGLGVLVVLPLLAVVAAPPALALLGGGAWGGAVVGVCAGGDCRRARSMLRLRDTATPTELAATVGPFGAWSGACAGCAVGVSWLALTSNAGATGETTNPELAVVLAAPAIGALAGGVVGGAVVGDVGTGVIAGAGGAVGAAAAPVAAGLLLFAPTLSLPLAIGLPWATAALATTVASSIAASTQPPQPESQTQPPPTATADTPPALAPPSMPPDPVDDVSQ